MTEILEFQKQSGAPSVDLAAGKPLFLCSPGWRYDALAKRVHRMSCKRRTCDCCGQFWAFKWTQALKEKAEYDRYHDRAGRVRALGLTFAEFVDYKQVWDCLRYFWRFWRETYGPVEYYGVVEFNQAHTQPHMHFILTNCKYLKWWKIKRLWLKAQKWAKIENPAWNIRIEEVKKSLQSYLHKYISKLKGGKDEIPRREEWQGRYVRYSKKFFPATIPTMALFARFRQAIEAGELLDYAFFYTRKPMVGLSGFLEKSDNELDKLIHALNTPWRPTDDRIRATILSPPAQAELPAGSGLLVAYDLPPETRREYDEFWQRYNPDHKVNPLD